MRAYTQLKGVLDSDGNKIPIPSEEPEDDDDDDEEEEDEGEHGSGHQDSDALISGRASLPAHTVSSSLIHDFVTWRISSSHTNPLHSPRSIIRAER